MQKGTSSSGQDDSGDPWANFRLTNGKMMNANPVGQSTTAQPRAVEGPIQAEFQKHDSRLAMLENSLQEIQARQTEQTQNHLNCVQLIEQKDTDLKQLMTATISNAKQEIESSLALAIAKQSQSLDSNLADLKAMLKEKKASKPKRGRDKESGDMETDHE